MHEAISSKESAGAAPQLLTPATVRHFRTLVAEAPGNQFEKYHDSFFGMIAKERGRLVVWLNDRLEQQGSTPAEMDATKLINHSELFCALLGSSVHPELTVTLTGAQQALLQQAEAHILKKVEGYLDTLDAEGFAFWTNAARRAVEQKEVNPQP